MSNYHQPFTASELVVARTELEKLTRSLQGRKLEEDDWTSLYCKVKGAPMQSWSNLPFRDYLFNGVGVEFKMLSQKNPQDKIGKIIGHPSATRAISFDENGDATQEARKVLTQWGSQIRDFQNRTALTSPTGTFDIRWGILLWAPDHSNFLYFEETLEIPNPEAYDGIWALGNHRGKPTRNLHIIEKATGMKTFSCTLPRNGAKLQPYFRVPTEKEGAVIFNPPPVTQSPLFVDSDHLVAMRQLFPGLPDHEIGEQLLVSYLQSQAARC